MADVNTNNEEKTPLNDAAVEPDLDPKAQFINGGKEIDPHVAIECGSGDDVSFTGLGKEELMQYADDPFWKKVRLILLIVFWAGWLAMLVAAIVIIVLAPKCPYRPDLKWYDKEAAYEIFPQSFQDSSPKPEGAAKEGDGVGDIKGKLHVYVEWISLMLNFTVPTPTPHCPKEQAWFPRLSELQTQTLRKDSGESFAGVRNVSPTGI